MKYAHFRTMNDSNLAELDHATEIALLWSTGGTKSILLNQWKSTMTENESVLINLFTGKIYYSKMIVLLNN